ncbi:MAG: ThuA domain-containing protein [Dictyoglomus sp.]|nr:ThuA domain-containing protein [Dictyoglomus sp.]MDW8188316.1 ThuA domain-containing protein [Dictyoglomus sp.]
MRKVLTLLGDYYHNHDDFLNTLKDILKPFSEIGIIDSKPEYFLNALLEKPSLVIIARENRINPEDKEIKTWMSSEIEEEIVKYVKNGGILFSWHSGLASYSPDGSYIKLIKGYFKYHPEKQNKVRYYSQNLFLGKRIDFEIVDEHYFVECDEKNTKVFLRSESSDGRSIAGWTHNFGEGKVICLTPAHGEGLKDKNFKDLLKLILEEVGIL